jgi:hypothetical protein
MRRPGHRQGGILEASRDVDMRIVQPYSTIEHHNRL